MLANCIFGKGGSRGQKQNGHNLFEFQDYPTELNLVGFFAVVAYLKELKNPMKLKREKSVFSRKVVRIVWKDKKIDDFR